jgi:hemerythrin-like domain-containing protein
MKPIGALMREHRLIERMVNFLVEQSKVISESRKVDTHSIDIAIDFFRTYAARAHHGKEEDILFRELAKKPLLPDHNQIMQELIQEHVLAGEMVSALHQANKGYSANSGTWSEVVKPINDIITLYPEHIRKEDERFFYPTLTYLTKGEQDAMLQEFWEFDRKMIHEKYQRVVEQVTGLKTAVSSEIP